MKVDFFRKLSQRQRLLLLLLMYSIIPVFVIGLISCFVTTSAVKRMAIDSSEEMIDRVSNDLDNLFIDLINIGNIIADDIDIQIILRNEYGSISEKYSYDLRGDTRLNFLHIYKQNIYGVYVLGQNGNKHKSRFTSFKDEDFRLSRWYKKILNTDEPVWFSTHTGSFAVVTLDDELISCGLQIIDKASGKKSGVILIDFEKELLKEILRSRLGKNGQLFIVDNMGNIIATAYPVGQNSNGIEKILKQDNNGRTEKGIYIADSDSYILFSKELKTNDWILIGTIPKSEIMEQSSFLGILIILCCIAVIGIFIAFSISASIEFVRPLNELKSLMKRVEKGNFNVQFETDREDEIGELSNGFNKMVNNIKELMERNIEEQYKLRKAELATLQAQINPHFLYNTLDSVVWLARKKSFDKIVEMVTALTSLFRISLSQGHEIISLKDEINHVRNYLVIQSMRYKDKFEYEIDISDSCQNAQILKLLVQPIVENAIYHGIKEKRGPGYISIKCRQTDSSIILNVEDTGIGIDPDELQLLRDYIDNHETSSISKNYGLKNVNERIKIYYGHEFGLEISSIKNEGTKVSIKIPKRIRGDSGVENSFSR